MDYKIVWTENAEDSFDLIIEYLQIKWSSKSAYKFIIKAFEIIELVQKNPLLFQKSELNEVRQILVTKQTYLFYELRDDIIYLLYFWDNRRNPSELSETIK